MVNVTAHQTADFTVAEHIDAPSLAPRREKAPCAPADILDVDHELECVTSLMQASISAPASWPATQASLYHLDTGGSLLRARLALLSGQAYGASKAHRTAAAAAAELVHNASLVHDDLCDGDTKRRGKAAVWKRYNHHVAVCTGDLLLTTAFRAALESDRCEHRLALITLLTRQTSQVIAGQSIEVAPPAARQETARQAYDNPPSLSAYLQATLAKTAPLIALPLEAGALGGTVSGEQRLLLQRFAGAAGLAYQIIDDLDDIDLACPSRSQPDAFHPYHAWPRHWPAGRPQSDDAGARAVQRAARHAASALARAEKITPCFPEGLGTTLRQMLADLQRRLLSHLHAAALDRDRYHTTTRQRDRYQPCRQPYGERAS